MNQTESARAELLEAAKRSGAIRDYWFEGGKVRLADGTFYTPDFLVWHVDGSAEFQEVKGGYIREDGLLKFKWARDKYPLFRWSLWQWRRNHWEGLL